jgi:hypothetical protein
MNDANWRKATYSENGGANCVEVGDSTRSVMIRDTKEHELGAARTVLAVTPAAWSAFLQTVR